MFLVRIKKSTHTFQKELSKQSSIKVNSFALIYGSRQFAFYLPIPV